LTAFQKGKIMAQCRKFSVEGRVQGVWFRESTRQQAINAGISGYARNCADGTVEVLACGEAEAINRLFEWLHRGPPMAQVRAVNELEFDGDCPVGFSTS